MLSQLWPTLAPLPAQADTTEINFGIISTESQKNLKQDWEPFIAAMSKQTGVKVNPFFASDYAGIIEAQKFNKVQIAWYGNKSAMEAVDRSDGQVFAQTVAKDGTQGYYGLLLANAENNALNSLDDIKKCDKSLVLRKWRSEFHLGLPGAIGIRVCGKQY